jgi:hypothetical protein
MFASQAGPFGKNNLMGHDDFLCTEIGQVGTQFDRPGHMGARMEMADGRSKNVYYNGFTVQDDMANRYGLKKLGVEQVNPYITRGVLIDIAGDKGMLRWQIVMKSRSPMSKAPCKNKTLTKPVSRMVFDALIQDGVYEFLFVLTRFASRAAPGPRPGHWRFGKMRG